MGRKKQRHTWPEAKKLCRLNQRNIEMAKRLGLGPDTLIRVIPSPKQKWKLPVKYWIRALHAERFGEERGETQAAPTPVEFEYDEEAATRFGEQLYWEDYWHRNADPRNSPARGGAGGKAPGKSGDTSDPFWQSIDLSDRDVPF